MLIAKDITGQKFNKLTAIKFIKSIGIGYIHYWLFRCDCGKEVIACKSSVTNNKHKSCGCTNKPKAKDISDKKFHKLTAVKFIEKRGKYNRDYWLFKCDCGNEKVINKTQVVTGHTKSCGCISIESTKLSNSTHGMSTTRFYMIYRNMINRCYNRNVKSYNNYGARGIKVCDRWLESFENFKDDMYESYLKHIEKFGEKNTQIDRNNNNKSYSYNNCSWETKDIQANNTRRNKFIEYNGKKYTLRNWEKKLNFSRGVLWFRLKHGWTIEKTINTPINIKRQKAAILSWKRRME